MTTLGVRSHLDLPRVNTVFQPLVELRTGSVVGFEALTRGPAEEPSPIRLLQQAALAGRLVEFDDLCRQAALGKAAEARLAPGLTWFLNTEPAGFARELDEIVADDHGLHIALEITERALSASPRSLMAAAERVHERGWLLALDDVGAHPQTLSLLPLIQPDVVKLDMRVVHRHLTPDAAMISDSVRAYSEATGALVLAEGIETPEHIEIAQAYGATHGQGYLFGRPDALPAAVPDVDFPLARTISTDSPASPTPYELASAARPTMLSTKQLLITISRQMEWQAMQAASPMVLLISVQHRKHWTSTMRSLYGELAERDVFAGVVGIDIPTELQEGVRGSSIAADDPVSKEWNVILVSPYHCAALSAFDLGDTDVADADRRFRYVVTHDRPLVTAMARSLFHRLSEQTDTGGEVLGWQ